MSKIEQLAQLKPADLPSPPQAALQILRACSRDDCSVNELSQLAGSDPLLTAELLRVVNTPLFGLSRQVQSINQAVTILGQRALRNLVLCLSVREAVDQHPIEGFDTNSYWEDTLRRAVSARLLGEQVAPQYDGFFTDGLLQDFGLLVMFYLEPELAGQASELRQLDPVERYTREQTLFDTTHTEVIGLLTRAWALPEELTTILGAHHDCEQTELTDNQRQICQVLHAADWMAAVYSATDKARVLEQARTLLSTTFGLSQKLTTQLLSAIPEQTEESASALGLHINQQADFDQIMREANARLAEANLSYQELTWKLEQTLKERDRLAAELNKELQLAREIQESLLPNNLDAGFPVTALNISARELSGDFYDYFPLPDGRIYFNLADVSGKGVNAALLMAKTSSLFHCLGKHIHNPAHLLQTINNELCETSTRGMFVSMIAGIFDPATSSAILVNAGHPPALLLNARKGVKAVEAMGTPLGILADTRYPEPIHLDMQNSSLYLFSDGVTEGQIQEGQMLGLDGLSRLLNDVKHLPPRERLQNIAQRFHRTGNRLRDDLTLLLVEAQEDG